MNIIIRVPNWIGDAVMMSAALESICSQLPDAQISLVGKPSTLALFRAHPKIKNFYELSSSHQLRKQHFTHGILFTNSFSSAWDFFKNGIKNRVGFRADFRSFLLSRKVPFPKRKEKEHLVQLYADLLRPIGLQNLSSMPTLYTNSKTTKAVLEKWNKLGINKGERIIGINPGAAYGSAKCWLPDRFKEVIRYFAKKDKTHVLVFGDSSMSQLVQELTSPFSQNVHNMCGQTTIEELIVSIKQCSVFLTNDSGPMHIAAALKTPLVALFGSTSEVKTGPYKHGTVIHKHVSCSPCYKKICPIDFRCMTSIHHLEVIEAMEKELNL